MAKRLKCAHKIFRKIDAEYEQFKPYLSINTLSVKSEFQGKGLMHKMVQCVIKHAEEEKLNITLDTENIFNITKYEKIGFEHFETIGTQGNALNYYLMVYKHK